MSENNKCFCHLNGYEVKDAKARRDIEKTRSDIEKIVNKKILVIGDSYAVPVRDDDETATFPSYADLLLQKFDGYKIASGGAGFVSYFGNKFINLLKSDINNISNKDDFTDIIVAGGLNDTGDSTVPISGVEISNAIKEFCAYANSQFKNAKIHIAFIGNMTYYMNQPDRGYNMYNVTYPAYANTDANYSYCTFSESIFYDRSLIVHVHPTEEGHIELYKYFVRLLNGNASFTRKFHAYVTPNTGGNKIGFHGFVHNGLVQYCGGKMAFNFGTFEIGPLYNMDTAVEVGTIDKNSILATPSGGERPWMIMGSVFVNRTSPTAGSYAGVGYLFPSNDGKKLMLQLSSPDFIGSNNDKATVSVYFMPFPSILMQPTM